MKKDQVIRCANCGQDFVWTADEQTFFAAKGLTTPLHCMICRSVLKNAKSDDFRGKIGNKE